MVKSIGLLVALVLVQITTLQAQFERGSIMAGGNVGFNYRSVPSDSANSFQINVTPQLGFFVSKHVVIGPHISFSYYEANRTNSQFTSHTSTFSIGVGPYVRYYGKISDKVYLFGHASPRIAYSISRFSKDKTQPYTNRILVEWEVGPGISFLLNDYVSIEPSVYYQGSYTKTAIVTSTNTLDGKGQVQHGVLFNIGLQIFLHKKKK